MLYEDFCEKGRFILKPKIHCILAALMQFLENAIPQTKPVENTIHWIQMRFGSVTNKKYG